MASRAGKAYDDTTVILCRNCHRKLSDPSGNAASPPNPPILVRIGRFLIGLAEFLIAMANKAMAFGKELLRGAQVCPWPWGFGRGDEQ